IFSMVLSSAAGGWPPGWRASPAIFVLAFPLAMAGRRIPDKRMAIETLLLLGVLPHPDGVANAAGVGDPAALVHFDCGRNNRTRSAARFRFSDPAHRYRSPPGLVLSGPAASCRAGRAIRPTTALVMALAVVGPLFVVSP